jgi:hypothetical protein
MQPFSRFSSSSQRRAARNLANEGLAILSRNYHSGLPIADIDKILTANGFNALEEAIYCGRDGRVHEPVGEHTWISFSWHKMDSGRYEVTVYVS